MCSEMLSTLVQKATFTSASPGFLLRRPGIGEPLADRTMLCSW